jgi:hypothetical protein
MLERHEEAVRACESVDIARGTQTQIDAIGRSMVNVGREMVRGGEAKRGSELVRRALRMDAARATPFEMEAWEVLCKASKVVGGGGARMGEYACMRAVELGSGRAGEVLTWAKGEREQAKRERGAREKMARERREREVKEARRLSDKEERTWKVIPLGYQISQTLPTPYTLRPSTVQAFESFSRLGDWPSHVGQSSTKGMLGCRKGGRKRVPFHGG